MIKDDENDGDNNRYDFRVLLNYWLKRFKPVVYFLMYCIKQEV